MNSNAKSLFNYLQRMYNAINRLNTYPDIFFNDEVTPKTIEALGAILILDPNDLYVDFAARKTPRKYIERELAWYKSKSNSVEELKDIKVWSQICDKNCEVNSNYGLLVFSRSNFSQFDNVLSKLKQDKYSRQGIIIYTRPSLQYEWNSLGAHDFICTNYQHFFIRNDTLYTITSMRSQDAIYGFFNDVPWFHYVIQLMYNSLKETYPSLYLGQHTLFVNSLHVYESHFSLLSNIVEAEYVTKNGPARD